MFELLLNLVRQADAIAVARVRSSRETEASGEKSLRVEASVQRALRGIPGRDTITIDIAAEGKETPALEDGSEWVFLLRDAPGAMRLVDLARPIRMPAEHRDEFLALFDRYREVADAGAPEAAVKPLLLAALSSPFPLFRQDAAKTALTVSKWSSEDLDRLATLVEGDEETPPLRGNDRDNLSSVVLAHAPVTRARDFARARLAEGDSDAVYFGLTNRSLPGTDEILGSLLRDPKEAIRIGAIRVAGLLRKPEALAAFERERGSELTTAETKALGAARALASRD